MDNEHKSIKLTAEFIELSILKPKDYGYLALYLSIITKKSAKKCIMGIEKSISK